jgi:hypothetical protein
MTKLFTLVIQNKDGSLVQTINGCTSYGLSKHIEFYEARGFKTYHFENGSF